MVIDSPQQVAQLPKGSPPEGLGAPQVSKLIVLISRQLKWAKGVVGLVGGHGVCTVLESCTHADNATSSNCEETRIRKECNCRQPSQQRLLPISFGYL